MKSRLLISASAIALLAAAGPAAAQDKGPSGGPAAAPQSTSPAQQSAPPSSQPGGSGAKDGGQVEQRQEAPPARAQQDMDRGNQKNQRAQDGREQRQDRAQDQRNQRDNRAQDKSDKKGGSATTGQGAAGAGNASLTTEQRSKISTNIRQTNVKRETNVNFNIAVGTVVPRTVTLHALPPTVIEVYPQWRGYRFVLVEDEIIIIEPGSYRIVAVIDA